VCSGRWCMLGAVVLYVERVALVGCSGDVCGKSGAC
jgi:hypothetical protein